MEMSKENNLLIAIPTYERCLDVKRQLEAIKFLSDYPNVQIVIFDSSVDNKTENVVNELKMNGLCNVKYEKIEKNISSNEKVFLIYENYANAFSYIWILHDHTIFLKEAFDYLIENLKNGDDFFFLRMQGSKYYANTYNDKQIFAQKNAWLLGKMGASIVKTGTFLTGIDWDYYRNKYITNKNINFSHVGFFFERFCDDQFSIVEIEFPSSQFMDTHKYEKLSWEKEALRICTECWGSVIMSLPDRYNNKKNIIASIDQYFLNTYKLLIGRQQGYYNILDYIRYKKWIRLVFPNLCKDAFYIAVLSKSDLMKKYVSPLKKRIKIEIKNGRRVYIYGAGKHGMECLELMQMAGIPINGFLVSNMEGNPEFIRGYRVYELRMVLKEKIPVFAILAVMDELQYEIISLLRQEVDKGQDITWMKY